jgi:hypothetical protein
MARHMKTRDSSKLHPFASGARGVLLEMNFSFHIRPEFIKEVFSRIQAK